MITVTYILYGLSNNKDSQETVLGIYIGGHLMYDQHKLFSTIIHTYMIATSHVIMMYGKLLAMDRCGDTNHNERNSRTTCMCKLAITDVVSYSSKQETKLRC